MYNMTMETLAMWLSGFILGFMVGRFLLFLERHAH